MRRFNFHPHTTRARASRRLVRGQGQSLTFGGDGPRPPILLNFKSASGLGRTGPGRTTAGVLQVGTSILAKSASGGHFNRRPKSLQLSQVSASSILSTTWTSRDRPAAQLNRCKTARAKPKQWEDEVQLPIARVFRFSTGNPSSMGLNQSFAKYG